MHLLPRISLFLTVTWFVLFGLHYYIWARLIRDTGLAKSGRLGLTRVLIVLGLLIPIGFVLTRSAPLTVSRPLLWLVYTWLGMAFFLNVLLFLTDMAKLLTVTFPLKLRGRPLDPERRLFLAQMVGVGVVLSNLGLSVLGLFNATAAAVRVKKIRVALSKLPQDLKEYRIIQVSDIHMGPTIGQDFIQTIVREVNALKPDLVAITGDLVDGTLTQLEGQTAPLKELRARDGVFFVTGNHEYYTGDVDEWLAWLSGIGIRSLRNEHITIRGGFDLAGTDDFSARGNGHHQDIPKALEGRGKDKPVILMAHQPRSFHEAKGLGVDLQLSGHTHGGQIYPFTYVVGLFQPYMAGLYQEGNSQLYVSRGTGYWGPPMRLGSPAEITEITLFPS